MLLDVNVTRVVCEGWYVNGMASTGSGESFGSAWQVQAGSNRLTAAAQTATRPNAPPQT